MNVNDKNGDQGRISSGLPRDRHAPARRSFGSASLVAQSSKVRANDYLDYLDRLEEAVRQQRQRHEREGRMNHRLHQSDSALLNESDVEVEGTKFRESKFREWKPKETKVESWSSKPAAESTIRPSLAKSIMRRTKVNPNIDLAAIREGNSMVVRKDNGQLNKATYSSLQDLTVHTPSKVNPPSIGNKPESKGQKSKQGSFCCANTVSHTNKAHTVDTKGEKAQGRPKVRARKTSKGDVRSNVSVHRLCQSDTALLDKIEVNKEVEVKTKSRGRPSRPPPRRIASLGPAVKSSKDLISAVLLHNTDSVIDQYEIGETLKETAHSVPFTSPSQADIILAKLPVNSPVFVKRTSGDWTYGVLIDRHRSEGDPNSVASLVVVLGIGEKKMKKKVIERSKWERCLRLFKITNELASMMAAESMEVVQKQLESGWKSSKADATKLGSSNSPSADDAGDKSKRMDKKLRKDVLVTSDEGATVSSATVTTSILPKIQPSSESLATKSVSFNCPGAGDNDRHTRMDQKIRKNVSTPEEVATISSATIATSSTSCLAKILHPVKPTNAKSVTFDADILSPPEKVLLAKSTVRERVSIQLKREKGCKNMSLEDDSSMTSITTKGQGMSDNSGNKPTGSPLKSGSTGLSTAATNYGASVSSSSVELSEDASPKTQSSLNPSSKPPGTLTRTSSAPLSTSLTRQSSPTMVMVNLAAKNSSGRRRERMRPRNAARADAALGLWQLSLLDTKVSQPRRKKRSSDSTSSGSSSGASSTMALTSAIMGSSTLVTSTLDNSIMMLLRGATP